jgi:hypothetical protein
MDLAKIIDLCQSVLVLVLGSMVLWIYNLAFVLLQGAECMWVVVEILAWRLDDNKIELEIDSAVVL